MHRHFGSQTSTLDDRCVGYLFSLRVHSRIQRTARSLALTAASAFANSSKHDSSLCLRGSLRHQVLLDTLLLLDRAVR
jgi:hypothetical protein